MTQRKKITVHVKEDIYYGSQGQYQESRRGGSSEQW